LRGNLLRITGNVLTLLALGLAVATHSSGFVAADTCSAQLGYPIITPSYADTGITVTVPLAATCQVPYGTQLYVTAIAYDFNTTTTVGTVNTTLTLVSGYNFTERLKFSLPASTQAHLVQVSVGIYNVQSSRPLTTVGEGFEVNSRTAPTETRTVSGPASYQLAPETYGRSHFILAYVAIAAILATVIIVTVCLVVYSKSIGPTS
jgi:predicted permease